MTLNERFWSKVDKDGPGGCWLWTASQNGYGYGKFKAPHAFVASHRYAYELLVGPIPDGLQIDHLCRNRACVNPAHLEPVTQRVNLMRGNTLASINARKTHCIRGHEFTPGPGALMVPRPWVRPVVVMVLGRLLDLLDIPGQWYGRRR